MSFEFLYNVSCNGIVSVGLLAWVYLDLELSFLRNYVIDLAATGHRNSTIISQKSLFSLMTFSRIFLLSISHIVPKSNWL